MIIVNTSIAFIYSTNKAVPTILNHTEKVNLKLLIVNGLKIILATDQLNAQILVL